MKSLDDLLQDAEALRDGLNEVASKATALSHRVASLVAIAIDRSELTVDAIERAIAQDDAEHPEDF